MYSDYVTCLSSDFYCAMFDLAYDSYVDIAVLIGYAYV